MKTLVPYFIKCFRCIKKYTPAYFEAIIKWYVYFVGDANKLVVARVTCLKTRLIRCDQIILGEKLEHWVYRVTSPEISCMLAREILIDSF